METDDDPATMRKSFSLVQNILFIGYTNIFPAHEKENMVEKLWKTLQFVFFFGILEGTKTWVINGVCSVVF